MDLKTLILLDENLKPDYVLYECSYKNVKNCKYLFSSNNVFLILDVLKLLLDGSKCFLLYKKKTNTVEFYNKRGMYEKTYESLYFL